MQLDSWKHDTLLNTSIEHIFNLYLQIQANMKSYSSVVFCDYLPQASYRS